MGIKYLLSCKCGEKIEIELYQAGQVITCQCGESCDVPSMSGIRDLPQGESSKVVDPEVSSKWNRFQGVLFALGVIVIVVSFFVTVYVGRPIFTLDATPLSLENITLEESMAVWQFFSTTPLEIQQSPLYVENALAITAAKKRVFFSLLGCLAGLASVATAFFLRPSTPQKKR